MANELQSQESIREGCFRRSISIPVYIIFIYILYN